MGQNGGSPEATLRSAATLITSKKKNRNEAPNNGTSIW